MSTSTTWPQDWNTACPSGTVDPLGIAGCGGSTITSYARGALSCARRRSASNV